MPALISMGQYYRRGSSLMYGALYLVIALNLIFVLQDLGVMTEEPYQSSGQVNSILYGTVSAAKEKPVNDATPSFGLESPVNLSIHALSAEF